MPISSVVSLCLCGFLFLLIIYLLRLIKEKDGLIDGFREKFQRYVYESNAQQETHKLTVVELETKLAKSSQEFSELEQKFKKNPSFECQQLLTHLMSGHALFHIETIDPGSVFLRRN